MEFFNRRNIEIINRECNTFLTNQRRDPIYKNTLAIE